jgi:type IV pilus assembly protein PilB
MTDPLDINALDTIETMTDHEVDPVICTERGLKQLMQAVYGIIGPDAWGRSAL